MTDTFNDISAESLNQLQNTANLQRVTALQNAFRASFNQEPTFFVNVPGR